MLCGNKVTMSVYTLYVYSSLFQLHAAVMIAKMVTVYQIALMTGATTVTALIGLLENIVNTVEGIFRKLYCIVMW